MFSCVKVLCSYNYYVAKEYHNEKRLNNVTLFVTFFKFKQLGEQLL